MNRRGLVALATAALAWPWAQIAVAQQRRPPFRVSVLSGTFPGGYDFASTSIGWLNGFGLMPGRDYVPEFRMAAGDDARLPALAAELVQLKVDVIVVQGMPAISAAKEATRSIPIVMVADGDPVANGLVQSLARPGGNMTGVYLLNEELVRKRLELLKELVPAMKRVGVLVNPADAGRRSELDSIAESARSLELTVHILAAREASDLPAALTLAKDLECGGIVILPDRMFDARLTQIQEFAIERRMPVIWPHRGFVVSHGEHALVSYGPDQVDLGWRVAGMVSRILRGAKPADMPVEQPSTFQLTINLKAAKALGIDVPQSMLVRADEVIE
jgi:putative ABC transport system substrate-binding protein